MPYEFAHPFLESTSSCVTKVDAIQLATVSDEFSELYKGRLLANPEVPGSKVIFALAINTSFFLVTDLKRWEPYKRYAPGPLFDNTGGFLRPQLGGVKLSIVDLQKIKEAIRLVLPTWSQ